MGHMTWFLVAIIFGTLVVAETLAIIALIRSKVEKSRMLSWTTVHGNELSLLQSRLMADGYLLSSVDITFETDPDGTVNALVIAGGRKIGIYKL